MDRRLIVAESLWSDLRHHLLCDGEEHLAFLLARNEGEKLLAVDLVRVADEELEDGFRGGLSLGLERLLAILNRANQADGVLLEAHSHPLSKHSVGFSLIDEQGQRELVSYLDDVWPGRLYGALVLSQHAVYGQVWVDGEPSALRQIQVLGASVQQLRPDGRPGDRAMHGNREAGLHDRQVLAFGDAGQEVIRNLRLAIVGLGGIGSMVLQELTYLGAQHFVLIDDDLVQVTNLNRLVGAGMNSIGQPKVKVAANHARSIRPDLDVHCIQSNARETSATEAIQSCDVIFGCVDTDAGRLILNELALAYLIPYIDCGVGIEASQNVIQEAGGRVVVWTPGRPCLQCCKEIDLRVAAEELESPEEEAFRRLHGYIKGTEIPAPSVISLNGIIASLGVAQFLRLATGFQPSIQYSFYDMLEEHVTTRVVKRDPQCATCLLEGAGNKAHIRRFSRRGLPRDIPKLRPRNS